MHTAFRTTALALGALALPSVAFATTIASSSSSTLFAGYSVTPFGLPPDGATTSTYNIGTGGGVWAGPILSSSWVSFDPNTAPGGSVTAPNGYYDYKIDFLSSGGLFKLTVLADDTTSVYLNGLHLLLPEGSGPYPKCATTQPNCVTPYTFDFMTGTGATYLDFEVHQANSNATGLDFYGTSVTPEPASFMLLGTGLVGGAGAILRRFRRA